MDRALNGAAVSVPFDKASDVVSSLMLAGLKTQSLTGKALERMKLIEQAVTCLEIAKLKKEQEPT
jgi:hypothetical protein